MFYRVGISYKSLKFDFSSDKNESHDAKSLHKNNNYSVDLNFETADEAHEKSQGLMF
ncbi:MAG: hypothetical protein KatS3mg084_0270 [Candidatus Dojkabacteria bacterium]|nr:MAG: hypothetical protein KatS3mg084_0270 [Candidatus Dojkabacteria bacterium]